MLHALVVSARCHHSQRFPQQKLLRSQDSAQLNLKGVRGGGPPSNARLAGESCPAENLLELPCTLVDMKLSNDICDAACPPRRAMSTLMTLTGVQDIRLIMIMVKTTT